jgi:hypothetical protein
LIIGWSKIDIIKWSQKVKSSPFLFEDPDFIIEAVAVIKRANFLHTKFHINDAQILSCLVALHAN